MLEYIAIANAAYKTIRSAIQNGRELHSVGKHIAAFTNATDEVRKGKDKKKNSIWSKFTGKDESESRRVYASGRSQEERRGTETTNDLFGQTGIT